MLHNFKKKSEIKWIVPNNKLRKNERVLYTVGVATTGYIVSESGQLFLTNQRLFSEKLISDDVAYSFELSEINDCRKGIFFAFPLIPWSCAKLIDKNGMVIKIVMCGFAGLQSKILVEELNKVLVNYTPVVEEKVKESNESDESPKDKLIKLNELKEEGLISEDDFNSKKEEILKEVWKFWISWKNYLGNLQLVPHILRFPSLPIVFLLKQGIYLNSSNFDVSGKF